jgi:hypothetical protein
MKVIDQRESPRSLKLVLSAPANSGRILFFRFNDPKVRVRVDGAELSSDSSQLEIVFPPGSGYTEKTVTVSLPEPAMQPRKMLAPESRNLLRGSDVNGKQRFK